MVLYSKIQDAGDSIMDNAVSLRQFNGIITWNLPKLVSGLLKVSAFSNNNCFKYLWQEWELQEDSWGCSCLPLVTKQSPLGSKLILIDVTIDAG